MGVHHQLRVVHGRHALTVRQLRVRARLQQPCEGSGVALDHRAVHQGEGASAPGAPRRVQHVQQVPQVRGCPLYRLLQRQLAEQHLGIVTTLEEREHDASRAVLGTRHVESRLPAARRQVLGSPWLEFQEEPCSVGVVEERGLVDEAEVTGLGDEEDELRPLRDCLPDVAPHVLLRVVEQLVLSSCICGRHHSAHADFAG
mmetsp:Transcript_44298/g.123188  ORF Transcript_44298/g.123188 Transcript_44298/m.123188 type:complete len:200 (-) Transcript_44298:46-645(-)